MTMENSGLKGLSLNVDVRCSVQDEYLMGSGEEIQIEVHIINTGDDAYEARLVMQMPLELMLVNVDKLAGVRGPLFSLLGFEHDESAGCTISDSISAYV